jgi:hypothetical protein
MIERDQIHRVLCFVGRRGFKSGFEQYDIRLISVHPGNIRPLFDLALFNGVMASGAGQWGIDLFVNRCIEMAVDAAKMGRLTHGDSVVYGFLPVAVATGALFSLVIEELFFIFIVSMMAFFTFVVSLLRMGKVQRFVKAHGLPGRQIFLFSGVAIIAVNRPGFLLGKSHLAMTGDATVVIDIHHVDPVGILKALEHRVNEIVFGQMAGGTIKVLGGQGFGVSVMQKFNRCFFESAKHGH